MRKEDEDSSHDLVIGEVKKQRMPYPNDKHPEWTTHTNPDQEHNFAITRDDADPVYPDLIVVETKPNTLKILGEVETESTISDDHAEQWKEYSKLCNTFYLYVPNGFEKEMKRLLTENEIKCSGIRVYWFERSEVKFADIA